MVLLLLDVFGHLQGLGQLCLAEGLKLVQQVRFLKFSVLGFPTSSVIRGYFKEIKK